MPRVRRADAGCGCGRIFAGGAADQRDRGARDHAGNSSGSHADFGKGTLMGLVPSKAIDRVQFYEKHVSGWSTNAVAIGTTTTAVTDLTTKTTAARAAYDAHQAAQDAARTAAQAWQQAVVTMGIAGSAII